MRSMVVGLGALLLGAGLATAACAQGSALERRVMAVPDGLVELHFDARAEACGDGARWYRFGDELWSSGYSEGRSASGRSECLDGPVRVLVTIAGREIVRLETFVGPLRHDESATDLGTVPGREASAWFVSLAARLDGRPARDAIGAALLAKEGASMTSLIALARDAERARDIRRSAIAWLPRAADATDEQVSRALAQLARDESDAPAIRQQAVSALLRSPRGAGVARLLELASVEADQWLAIESTRALARSGDPRARSFLRTVVSDAKRTEAVRTAAVNGLGGEQASGADAKLLREAYRTLPGERTKDAALVAISSIGGHANVAWLATVAKDEREASTVRRRAVGLTERAGASGVELSALYDAVGDSETRGAVIGALGQEGSKPAREKLIAIAKSTETPSLRKRAIAALERLDSQDVRDALMSIAVPRP